MNWWSDFWGDAFEWIGENVMMPLCVLLIVGAIVGGSALGWHEYSENKKQNEDPVRTAIVVERIYHPPITTYVMVGKVMAPVTSEESWSVKVQGVSENQHEVRTLDIPVTHAQYEATRVGQEFVLDK